MNDPPKPRSCHLECSPSAGEVERSDAQTRRCVGLTNSSPCPASTPDLSTRRLAQDDSLGVSTRNSRLLFQVIYTGVIWKRSPSAGAVEGSDAQTQRRAGLTNLSPRPASTSDPSTRGLAQDDSWGCLSAKIKALISSDLHGGYLEAPTARGRPDDSIARNSPEAVILSAARLRAESKDLTLKLNAALV